MTQVTQPRHKNSNSAAGQPGDWNAPAVYALGFLTLISTFNYLDRNILGLALPFIKTEMGVSDTALGLVSGLAFVLFYSVLGIPIAWLADRWNRRNIIAIGLIFWSIMTALTGLVGTIWQLALVRFLMGAGEACGLAPSNSMISDLFRRARRPLALSIFGLAGAISYAVFFPIAGMVIDAWGWRTMFVVAGIPGVFLGVLFYLTVREPARGSKEERHQDLANATMPETIKFLAGSRTYLFIVAGITLTGANSFAASVWVPTFLERVHGLSMGEVASTLGPLRGILGAIGIIAGGILIDRLGKRDEKLRLRLPAISCLFLAPAELIFLLSASKTEWVVGYGLTSFFLLMHQGPVFAVALGVARVRMRAVAISILVFFATLVGQVVGPLMIGFLNDLLEPTFGNFAIRYSMLFLAATAFIAGILFWFAGQTVESDNLRASAEV